MGLFSCIFELTIDIILLKRFAHFRGAGYPSERQAFTLQLSRPLFRGVHDMTLQQLHYLSEVAQLGSINKAAQNLFVSQSTISSSISDLEEEFQLKLFFRSKSGVILTPDGKEFLSQARSLLDQERRIEALFKGSGPTHSRRLIVASQHILFAVLALTDTMAGFSSDSFSVCLKELLVGDLLEDILADRSDLGVLFLTDVTKRYIDTTVGQRVEFHELCRLRPRVCVRRGHPLSRLDGVTEADLEGFPYLSMYQESVPPFDHAEETRLSFGYKPEQVIYVTDRGTIDDILLATDAYHISCGMDSVRNQEFLQLLPFKDSRKTLRLGWIHLSGKQLPEEAKLFLSHLSRIVTDWCQSSGL